ncbi:hypothetical protein GOP47_0023289 [Adiantum capillus-veneris]|uniref:Uncharacterized protein n=1 Tax=Adiantum capillus-veneris TaxID=13818 RepID=A0A9D4U7G1_ADICA|nr:hypothetical protein GOP47_0023289 [Adiantum capillus-veneris]
MNGEWIGNKNGQRGSKWKLEGAEHNGRGWVLGPVVGWDNNEDSHSGKRTKEEGMLNHLIQKKVKKRMDGFDCLQSEDESEGLVCHLVLMVYKDYGGTCWRTCTFRGGGCLVVACIDCTR